MGPRKFRKIPVEITAIQWTGDNIDAVLEFLADGNDDFEHLPSDGEHVTPGIGHTVLTGELEIPTLEGTMIAQVGDYIIRGIVGEFYPCKPDIFWLTYEQVEPFGFSHKEHTFDNG